MTFKHGYMIKLKFRTYPQFRVKRRVDGSLWATPVYDSDGNSVVMGDYSADMPMDEYFNPNIYELVQIQ